MFLLTEVTRLLGKESCRLTTRENQISEGLYVHVLTSKGWQAMACQPCLLGLGEGRTGLEGLGYSDASI
jgi:hypothetical protein